MPRVACTSARGVARHFQSSSQGICESQPPGIAFRARTEPAARDRGTLCVLPRHHELRGRERRYVPLAWRFCHGAVRPTTTISALGTASSAGSNSGLECPVRQSSAACPGGIGESQNLRSLSGSNGGEPPNSAAAPDRVPFVGSALPRLVSARRSASRCRNRKARGRVSGSPLGR